ncbi:hypothetical protein CC78DRAFT_260823 [Lojkania enalia]|uniref:Uncharacterized protein n=1 Tax=Lojkania enalia TaxID=147567 RepID=A0A9P4N5V4_9PLEO|nr:hypothetical protein CC78DRAFT_260823 [Didymosphaeria enalia]
MYVHTCQNARRELQFQTSDSSHSYLGYRTRQSRWIHVSALNFTRILVLVLYFLTVNFVLCTAIVEIGLGSHRPPFAIPPPRFIWCSIWEKRS